MHFSYNDSTLFALMIYSSLTTPRSMVAFRSARYEGQELDLDGGPWPMQRLAHGRNLSEGGAVVYSTENGGPY